MPNENSYEVALQKSNAIREGLAKTPEKFTMLTGDRPTGRLHLGHYFGTLKGRVELQNMGAKTNVLIADYQVITDRDTTEHIQDNVYNMVMDYLACGIDPDKTMIYAHSAVPAANQLMLPFLSLVSEAELARNPTVKAEMEASGHELTGLLLTYPVHQACDILFCKGNVVPVGRDQLPHIELTRTIARRFNNRYGKVFPEVDALLSETPLLPGLDGRKMSKSYDNTIALFGPREQLKKQIMSIVTDSRAPGEPKSTDGSALYQIYRAFADDAEAAAFAQAFADGIAWGDAKQRLFERIDAEIGPMRERYQHLIAHPEEVEQLLLRGAEKARAIATPFMRELRHAVGLRPLQAAAQAGQAPAAIKTEVRASFKQYREQDGRFYFKLVDATGQVLLQSRGFDSPREAGQAVKRLQTDGTAALDALGAQLDLPGGASPALRDALQMLQTAQQT